MIFWFSGVALIGGTIAISSAFQLASGAAQTAAWFGLLAPFAMIAFGFLLYAFGSWLSSGDKAFLIAAVRRAVNVEGDGISLQG